MPVFWWKELDLVPLKGSARPNSVFSGIYGLGMALGSLCTHVWCCVPVLLKVWCEISGMGLAGYWLGFCRSAEIEDFGTCFAT